MFRYKLLYDRGGWWVDLDMICIHPFDFSEDTIVSSERTKTGGVHPSNGILKAPIGSPLMGYLWEVCSKMSPFALKWGDTRTALIRDTVAKLGLTHIVKSPETFCPVPWWEAVRFIDPNPPAITSEAHAVHLWNEQWKEMGINKTTLTPRKSILSASAEV